MNSTNWDGFRYFVAAAETGSLSAAATLLESNQPTVGRYIDALEASLEIKLFQRHAKGLTLTEEGKYVFEQSKSMRSLVIKAKQVVPEGAEEIGGTVQVAIPEGLCMEILLPQLLEFYKQHPQIRLILNVASATANLTSGEAEVAIRLFRPDDANLVVKHIGDMEMGLYASSDYCAAHGKPTTIADLKQHPVIAYGDALSDLPENQWLVDHTNPASCLLRSDSTTARLKATVNGLGISIQPRIFSIANKHLLPLIEGVSLPKHEVWLVYHCDLRHTGRVRAVVDFISSALSITLKGSCHE